MSMPLFVGTDLEEAVDKTMTGKAAEHQIEACYHYNKDHNVGHGDVGSGYHQAPPQDDPYEPVKGALVLLNGHTSSSFSGFA
jgi:hypothetical protein